MWVIRQLRLYCLRVSDSVLIAGNGGVKDVNVTIEEHTISDVETNTYDI